MTETLWIDAAKKLFQYLDIYGQYSELDISIQKPEKVTVLLKVILWFLFRHKAAFRDIDTHSIGFFFIEKTLVHLYKLVILKNLETRNRTRSINIWLCFTKTQVLCESLGGLCQFGWCSGLLDLLLVDSLVRERFSYVRDSGVYQ